MKSIHSVHLRAVLAGASILILSGCGAIPDHSSLPDHHSGHFPAVGSKPLKPGERPVTNPETELPERARTGNIKISRATIPISNYPKPRIRIRQDKKPRKASSAGLNPEPEPPQRPTGIQIVKPKAPAPDILAPEPEE